MFVDRSGGATALFSAANRSVSADERLQWVELATGATISRAVAVQQVADTLEDADDMVFAANRSAIGKFVDGLVASPPICESVPLVPVTAGAGAPPPPPNWEHGEQLSGIDLISVGTRFQVAAAAVDAGPLREEFLAAGTRLFDAGAARL